MSTKTHQLWQQAASLAARAHRHQVRKDGATPYAAHPFRVAMTVRHVFGCEDDAVLAAALLHDTIEDTGTDYDEILEQFGTRVADLVACMTKDMRLVESERERAYDAQLARGPWQARLLKLADVYDNLSEAADERTRRKMAEKARRALTLAAGDVELTAARQAVEALMAEMGVG
ncbi:MAG: bifunctional (p)ppGpp synthetase/guanosine-3',5'-bis(diphosphate) 3'-pyrophosphohydrolase [Phycisphaeraceae bacterium]|nr:MAG: bifunctional (p)ppGpp synthetase/guanosine-3',5'-bis(diphosphate) 3'-pyrophosphohydrolase [Phycisphaeraceae bacterium]